MTAEMLNKAQNDYPERFALIREALVREIRDSDRWIGVTEAWEALLHVRHMAKRMKKEHDFFIQTNGSQNCERED